MSTTAASSGGNLSPRNMLVFDALHFKLCDFAGSILRGVYPELHFTYDVRCWVPGLNTDTHAKGTSELELFALGAAICEIIEWTVPYGPFDEAEVDERRRKGKGGSSSIGK